MIQAHRTRQGDETAIWWLGGPWKETRRHLTPKVASPTVSAIKRYLAAWWEGADDVR